MRKDTISKCNVILEDCVPAVKETYQKKKDE